jgi:hypothetical protein
MADIKVIYKNASGFDEEHSEAGDSIKMLSFKTANNELTDAKLDKLIDGADAANEHTHDGRYFQESEHINASAGVADAAKPIVTASSGKIDPSLIDISGLDHGGLTGLGDDDHTQYVKADGTRDITGTQSYASLVSISAQADIPHKKYVDDAIASAIIGQEWLESADTRAITPPGSPTTGYRVLIDGTLGSATGAFSGNDNRIAEWSGSAWIFQPSATIGTFISVDDEPNNLYYFGGTWEAKAFESTTASGGLTKLGIDIRLDSASAGNGLGFSGGVYSVNVDNSSIEITTDSLNVKAQGIKESMIDFGSGAGQVSAQDLPIVDAGGLYAATETEGALQEVGLLVRGLSYVAGENLVKGDLVYISGNDTVSKLSSLSSNAMSVGIVRVNAATSANVRASVKNATITGVLSGATAGQKIYWTGSTLSSTMPTGSGSNVWLAGVAKNATDLVVDVQHIKKNA